MSDRFVVTELTGYRIGRSGKSYTRGGPVVSFYVHDTAYLYEVVATFHSARRRIFNTGSARRCAEAFAAQLNEWDRLQ